MIETAWSIVVLSVALLPGMLYTWSLERQIGRWGTGLSDRLARFAAASAVFHVLLLPLSYWLYSAFVATDALANGRAVPWWLWPVVGAYVVVPMVAGRLIGESHRVGRTWIIDVFGSRPAPNAWDHLFSSQRVGWVRLKLRSGAWVGGAYSAPDDGDGKGLRSFAASYPERADLFLRAIASLEPDGSFRLDRAGRVETRDAGLLVRWDDVEYLEFHDA